YEAEDEDVQAIEGESHQALMAYSMATKDYVTALPLIKSTLATTNQPAKRRKLLRWMQIAAEGIGDKDTQIAALRMYNDMLVDRDTSSSSDRAKELDIRTRVSELKADNVHLQIEKEKEEKESYQRIMTFVMVGWILFALLLFGILVIWARYRAASVKIGQFVDNLDAECVYLKDQHYRDYLHSKEEKSIDLLNRKRIERRKRKRSILDKLNYILNDLLYIASIGKIGRGKFVRPVSVIEVIDDESSIAMANQASDVELDIVYPVKDIEMRTDKECLEYVLHHLFYAANRVAEGGKICLEVKESEDGRKVDFIFTNSSVFVPEGNEDVMFDNFIDLSKLTDRDDAGLFIARLSALLINSSLYLDRGFN
ncbi:MAG: hypothetical protein K2G23_11090, partial [Muribaculaceae bacterium]|nr:hypothetical protein [Muribaculaceae bacterium]